MLPTLVVDEEQRRAERLALRRALERARWRQDQLDLAVDPARRVALERRQADDVRDVGDVEPALHGGDAMGRHAAHPPPSEAHFAAALASRTLERMAGIGEPRVLYLAPGLAGLKTSLTSLFGLDSVLRWGRGGEGYVERVHFERRPVWIDLGPRARALVRQPLGARRNPRSRSSDVGAYESARRASLEALDGVVYVADSQPARDLANVEHLELLASDLSHVGRDPAHVPLVFQLNKRDMPRIHAIEELRARLPWPGASDYIPTVAPTGRGVAEALRRLLELVTASAS